MLTALFRSNQPWGLALLPVLVPLLFGPLLAHQAVVPAIAMPLHELLGRATSGSQWLPGAITMIAIALIGVQLVLLLNTTGLMARRTHLAALLFPLLYAAFGPNAPLDPALLGMVLVVPAMHRAWSMNNAGRAMGHLFDAGALIGIAALFYLPYAFLIVVVWASISVIRSFQWREHIMPLLGGAVVFYFTWAIMLLIGSEGWEPLLSLSYAHMTDASIGTVPSSQRILLAMVLTGIIAVGVLSYARSYQRGIIHEKNIRSSFLAMTMAFSLVIAFIWAFTGVWVSVLLATPLAVFCVQALQSGKRPWIGESVVFSLLILALWAQWGW